MRRLLAQADECHVPFGGVIDVASDRMVTVYPRACGGTKNAKRAVIAVLGHPRACGGTGGEIVLLPAVGGLSRACGGTVVRVIRAALLQGLSPRLRGNRLHR